MRFHFMSISHAKILHNQHTLSLDQRQYRFKDKHNTGSHSRYPRNLQALL